MKNKKIIKKKKNNKKKFNKALFLKYSITNLIIFTVAVIIYKLIIDYLANSATLYPIQLFEANIVYFLQNLLGVSVEKLGIMLLYPGFNISVESVCIGAKQALFLVVLLLSYYPVSFITRLKGISFVLIIFAENILRLSFVYPLFLLFGAETANALHEFLYTYGQGFFMIALFILWHFIFVQPEYRQRKRSKKGQ